MNSLDTGPYCCDCGVHRAQSAGTRCPSCLEDRRKELQAQMRTEEPK